MDYRLHCRVLTPAAVALLVAASAGAGLQEVVIRVVAPSGEPLHRARVDVSHLDFAKTPGYTDCNGEIHLLMTPGVMSVEASYPGCETLRADDVSLGPDAGRELTLQFQPGQCPETLSPKERAALRNDSLTSPSSVYATVVPEYDLVLRNVLLKNSPHNPYVRVIVRPSFESEWMVEIDQPVEDSATIRLIEVEAPVWNTSEPRRQPSRVTTGTISRSIAQEVRRAWMGMLDRTQPPHANTRGFDGTTYLFSAWVSGRGDIEGEVWSPPECNITSDLVRIGNTMRSLVRREISPADAERRLRMSAGRLLEELAQLE